MDAVLGPVRPVGAGDYQPPRKRAVDPNKQDAEPARGVPLPDQIGRIGLEIGWTDLMADIHRADAEKTRQLSELRAYLTAGNQRPLAEDEPARVLAHGLDTLYVTFDVEWSGAADGGSSEPRLWAVLDEARLKAAGDHPEQAGTRDEGVYVESGILVVIPGPDGYGDLYANVQAHGASGYRWLLQGRGFALKIARQLESGSRPGIMLEVGSEVCWRHGAREFVTYIEALLKRHGATLITTKPSRADFCVDLLVPAGTISRDCDRRIVCQARKYTPYAEVRKPVHAVTLGEGGTVSLRIYDKPKEINDKGGGKSWFYGLWLIEPGDVNKVIKVTKAGRIIRERLDVHIPAGCQVLRVEFELKREALKELGAITLPDLFEQAPAIWQYLTGKWCRFVDRPDTKRDRQAVLPWWAVLSSAWPMAWEGPSAIRAACPSRDAELLARGALGYLSSLLAADAAGGAGPAELEAMDIDKAVGVLKATLDGMRRPHDDLDAAVVGKLAKHDKGLRKFAGAVRLRKFMRRFDRSVREAAQTGQPERTIRVPDESANLARRYWDRVFRTESDRQVTRAQRPGMPGSEKTPETLNPPEIEQLQIGF